MIETLLSCTNEKLAVYRRQFANFANCLHGRPDFIVVFAQNPSSCSAPHKFALIERLNFETALWQKYSNDFNILFLVNSCKPEEGKFKFDLLSFFNKFEFVFFLNSCVLKFLGLTTDIKIIINIKIFVLFKFFYDYYLDACQQFCIFQFHVTIL